jgi:hypothetical protein
LALAHGPPNPDLIALSEKAKLVNRVAVNDGSFYPRPLAPVLTKQDGTV